MDLDPDSEFDSDDPAYLSDLNLSVGLLLDSHHSWYISVRELGECWSLYFFELSV